MKLLKSRTFWTLIAGAGIEVAQAVVAPDSPIKLAPGTNALVITSLSILGAIFRANPKQTF